MAMIMTTTITTTTPSPARAPAKEIAPFLKNLRRMLDNEPPSVLRWTDDGCAFEIHDLARMTAHVLPTYFKHAKYSSFQRQLNYFHFRKWTRSRTPVCTFSNPFFQRDAPDLAWRISRKKSIPSTTTTANSKHQKMTITVPTPSALSPSATLPMLGGADEWDGLRSPNDAVAMVEQTAHHPDHHYDMHAAPTAHGFDATSLEWIDTLYPSLEALSQLHDGPAYSDLEPLPALCSSSRLLL